MFKPFLSFIYYLILTVVFITIYIYVLVGTVHAEERHVDLLKDGSIDRIPLVQPGQTFRDIAHGWHQVTGGYVNTGVLGHGSTTRVIGTVVIDNKALVKNCNYIPGNQPFNRNFASILYELKEAGQCNANKTSLGYDAFGRNNLELNYNMRYLLSCIEQKGLAMGRGNGQITITNKLINSLAK